ncbi:MAG: hypothetical protein HGA96_13660 [Desulfobulbaceae bacterium]|nr:hypothetical protein [Desulfobulbaceae bacterium]
MGQLKFISREKLIEYLDEELRRSLNERGLYEINQYGWLADGELDPEYSGHALWQEKPPELKKLLVLGDEFTCLMRSARHSLGLTCLYHDATDSLLNDSGYSCSFYFADTINKLSLASDRIREFLVTAFAHRSPGRESWPPLGKIIRGERAYDTFRAPFQHILTAVSSWSKSPPSLREQLTEILTLAEKIAHKRSKNQDPVFHLTLFQNRINTAISNLSMGYPDEALSDDLSSANDSSSQELVDWHNALIEISNLIFMAEHSMRRLNRQTRAISGRPQRHKVM